MSAVTLETVQAKQASLASEHTKLAEMIKQLAEQAKGKTLVIDGIEIEIAAGELYAGAVLDADGNVQHHLIVLAARPAKDVTWNDAKTWAASVGGELPNRQEQALISANCKPHLEARWHWSSEEHENASFAWVCVFGNGYQYYYHQSHEFRAVAVRRVNP